MSRRIATWIGVGVVILAIAALGANVQAAGSSSLTTGTNGTLSTNVSLNPAVTGGNQTITPSGPTQIDPSLSGPPTDPDGDGIFEDLNGNGGLDFDDVVVFFQYILDPAVTDHTEAFDSNGNGRIDFDDIVRLFREI